jgi:hypothetical protein
MHDRKDYNNIPSHSQFIDSNLFIFDYYTNNSEETLVNPSDFEYFRYFSLSAYRFFKCAITA